MMQSGFTAALLDPDLPVPEGLVDAQGRPAGRRFAVYRNNVAGSLTEALRAAFPVLEALLGAEYFSALAGVFLRSHPPRQRVMMLYGADFPEFIEGFPPLAHLPYLGDVARLEQGLREAYHAADATPLAVETLAGLSPEGFEAARLRLAPALRLLRSAHPALSIWRANREKDAPAPQQRAEDILILRPDYDPIPHLLPPGGADFIAGLLAGDSIGAAVDRAGEGFDLGPVLTLLIQEKAFVEIV